MQLYDGHPAVRWSRHDHLSVRHLERRSDRGAARPGLRPVRRGRHRRRHQRGAEEADLRRGERGAGGHRLRRDQAPRPSTAVEPSASSSPTASTSAATSRMVGCERTATSGNLAISGSLLLPGDTRPRLHPVERLRLPGADALLRNAAGQWRHRPGHPLPELQRRRQPDHLQG